MKTVKSKFSTCARLHNPDGDSNKYKRSRNRFESEQHDDAVEELQGLADERSALQYDLGEANQFKVSTTKVERNVPLTESEIFSMRRIKRGYSAFFESDSEDENKVKDEFSTPHIEARKKVDKVITYLKNELYTNKQREVEVVKSIQPSRVVRSFESAESAGSHAESSTSSSRQIQALAPSSEQIQATALPSEQIKPLAPSSEQVQPLVSSLKQAQSTASSSKQVHFSEPVKPSEESKSVHDFVENLSQDYNPFDDIGYD